MRQKREKSPLKKRFKLAYFAIIIPVFAILIFAIWSIQFIGKIPFSTVERDFPATIIFLLEFGVAIIGIAVSVWIGLNIYNVIAKDDLVSLENQIDILNGIEAQLRRTQQNQNAAIRTMLLSSLMKTQKDVMSAFFIDQITNLYSSDLDSALLSKMLLIEEAFSNIVAGYHERNRIIIDKFYTVGKEYCSQFKEELRDKSNDQREPEMFNFYHAYLYFRDADFDFYYSIRPSNPPHRDKEAEAKNYYEKLAMAIENFGRVLNLLESLFESGIPQKIKSYIDNSIGYSYYQKYLYLREHGDIVAAKKYCSRACYPDGESLFQRDGYDKSFARSVYYRNYANCISCFTPGLEGVEEAARHFQRSLELDYHDAKAHYNVASFKLKAIVEKEHLGKDRKQAFNAISISEHHLENIDTAIKNLNWAMEFDSNFTDPYFLLAHAYTLKMLAMHDEDEKEKLFQEAVDMIDTYKQLCPGNSTDAYLFYERNLYEAHGDIDIARQINSMLTGGDSKEIGELYAKIYSDFVRNSRKISRKTDSIHDRGVIRIQIYRDEK